MANEEKRLLANRAQIEQQHATDLLRMICLLFAAIFVFSLILFWRIRNDLLLRQRFEIDQKRLTDILNATPDLIGNISLEGDYTYLNKGGRQLLGLDLHEDISRQKVYSMRPPWAKDLIFNHAIPDAINNGIWAGENAFINRAGLEIPVSQVIVLQRNADGTASHLSTVVRDIRDIKKIENDLTETAHYDQTHSEILRLFNASYNLAEMLPSMHNILAQNHAYVVSAVYCYEVALHFIVKNSRQISAWMRVLSILFITLVHYMM